ncbi:MAG: hypothetical protein AAF570_10220, partial [Bacteroidota bacterium]
MMSKTRQTFHLPSSARKGFPALLFLLLMLSGVLSSCNRNVVKYGVFGKYRLDEGEQQVGISEEFKVLFQRMCEVEGLDLAINRAFSGEAGIFISMAFHLIPPDFHAKQEADSTFKILEQKDFADSKMVYKAYMMHKHDVYMCRIV